VRVLCELGRVGRLSELGTTGPLVASAGTDSLFHCLFGRDAIRMAADLLPDFPAVAHTTLIELARLQGVEDNSRSEEEPGRIVHEHRHPDDPHAMRLAKHWDFPYYGAVDTTPQWINLLGAYTERHGLDILDERLTDRLWRPVTLRDSLLAALAWISRRLDDPIGSGFVWVRRANSQGLRNQVWEDSFDSYYHADGTLFDEALPYAPVAVQAYAYDALLVAADLLEASPGPLPVEPGQLRGRAALLRERLLAEFWLPQRGIFAHAVVIQPDHSLQPAHVVASAAGHLLASRVLEGADARIQREQLIARFAEPDPHQVDGSAALRARVLPQRLDLADGYGCDCRWAAAVGPERGGRCARATHYCRLQRGGRVPGVLPRRYGWQHQREHLHG
jgi:glycogen debranching enzyme